MSKVENPPAFPLPDQYRCDGEPLVQGQCGMSLRDYFAGQALAGILANPSRLDSIVNTAEAAYAYADAMLEERASSEGQP